VSRSAVVVTIAEAEPIVGGWRLQHTADGALGMPSHVTLLFPFVPVARLTEGVQERLASVLATTPAFDVVFPRTARFPLTLYLAPEPAEPFARLTEAIAAEWPEHPPYEGEFETVVPHLTVAESGDGALLDRIAAEVESRLPIQARVREGKLYSEGAGGRWRERRRLPLAGGP
jgi:2'-5' RNA ligase